MIAYYAQDPYFLDLETMLDENDFRFITEDIVSDKARPIEQVINFIESNFTRMFHLTEKYYSLSF